MEWWKKKHIEKKRGGKKHVGPVIAPQAIQSFLNRPREDYTWIKQVPKEQLLEELDFEFVKDPYKHQAACVVLGAQLKQFLFLLDMGAGKTKILLDTFQYLRKHERIDPLLVLVPAAVNMDGWAMQIKEHAPSLKYIMLTGSKADRHEDLQDGIDVFLLNYDGLQSYMTKLADKTKNKDAKGRTINYTRAHRFAQLFGMVAYDESHLIGNKTSLRFRMCNILSDEIEYRYASTGTPFGRDPTMLWSQFFLVDRGETLGETLGLFRAAFFDAKENYFGGYKYTFDKSKEEKLHRIMRNRSIYYEETEFSDKPRVQRDKSRLSFPIASENYYKQVLQQLRQSKGDVEAQQNAFLRMRQVCAGFMTIRGEDIDKTEVEFYNNPKLEQLEIDVQCLKPENKVIIIHEFIRSGSMISTMLDRLKIKHARVGNKVKNPIQQLRNFMEKPDCRVLIMSHKAGGGAGLNLHEVCRRIWFYESPSSPITRKQIEKRVSGGLRTRKWLTFIKDYVIAGSVDEMILQFHKQGEDLFDALCKGKVKM
jgi:SNF2 family DNA or RNA helicase